jgi:hypothetical protein
VKSDAEKNTELEKRIELLELQLRLCFEKLDGKQNQRKRTRRSNTYQEIGAMSLADFSDDEGGES